MEQALSFERDRAVAAATGDVRRILLAGDTHSMHTSRLAAALCRRGIDVAVLNGAHLVDRVRAEHGAEMRDLAFVEKRLRGNTRVAALGRLEQRLNRHRLRRLVARCAPDVIHVHNLYCNERLDRLVDAGDLQSPVVVTAWGTDVDDSAVPKHRSYQALREALLTRATLVTGDSEAMLRRCRSFVPERPAEDFRRVRWLPDAGRFNVDVAACGRRVWRQRLGIASSDFVILSHRQTRPTFQIDRIVRAFAAAFPADERAAGSVWSRAVLIVKHVDAAGVDQAAYLEELRQMARPFGTRVQFVGQIPYDDVPALFGAADMAIGIPAADGAPASIPELQALGVPLIVSDMEDYDGLVEDGRNAVVIDASSDEVVAAAMRRLASDDALRMKIRAGALASAAELGGLAATVNGFIDCYREAIIRVRRRSSASVSFLETTSAGPARAGAGSFVEV